MVSVIDLIIFLLLLKELSFTLYLLLFTITQPVTKTCPCNKRRFYRADKMKNLFSLAFAGWWGGGGGSVGLDLRCIENVLIDYDSKYLQKKEST